MENHHPSTLLSMDSSVSSSHDDLDLEKNHSVVLSGPPDINLLLSAEIIPSQQPWNFEYCDILNVGLNTQFYESDSFFSIPRVIGKKCEKRVESIWGAWFFFSFYFNPVLNEKSKGKMIRDNNGVSGFDKSDLQLDIFMVQHDMENMYMWVFKERPENALGKMQLRSFMNGHSRQGERVFPFSADKGFVRSHRMQRKHYRGLSNPQCVHGIKVVPCPNLVDLDEGDRERWIKLTGRDIKLTIPPEASDYNTWRNMPNNDFETDTSRPLPKGITSSHSKKLLNGSALNLLPRTSNHSDGDVMDPSPVNNKREKNHFSLENNVNGCSENAHDRIPHLEFNPHPNEPLWLNEFSGVLSNVYGPVTAAKTMYEDDEGFLIVVSLPLVDQQNVRVSWRNAPTHGIVKVSCLSTGQTPFIKRHNRTFKLADISSDHCPPGEFVREIPLGTRIPQDAKIEAYYDGPGTLLEILVPKLPEGPEEHEVPVSIRPHHDLMLT